MAYFYKALWQNMHGKPGLGVGSAYVSVCNGTSSAKSKAPALRIRIKY
jgi:hypothetical protein